MPQAKLIKGQQLMRETFTLLIMPESGVMIKNQAV
jgi:hypothetical protein